MDGIIYSILFFFSNVLLSSFLLLLYITTYLYNNHWSFNLISLVSSVLLFFSVLFPISMGVVVTNIIEFCIIYGSV